MKPIVKKILWGVAIFFIVLTVVQTIQLFFINGTVWKHRSVLEEELLSGKSSNYEPRLKAEILQTESYKKFKKTKVGDSLRVYFYQAVAEGKARLKTKDSTDRHP
jgi:hypothetical protein